MRGAAWAVLLLAFASQMASADELKVPTQYGTIQAAVNAANPGDTVKIAPGTYRGPDNVDIDLLGKAITVQGSGYLSTVIDCEGINRGFFIHSGETSSTQIASLTIRRAHEVTGGAFCIVNSSPAIVRCSIEDCIVDQSGAAAAISNGNPGFVSCQFKRNRAPSGGGAIYTEQGSPTFSGCTFEGNETTSIGGAICVKGGAPFIVSSIFNDNVSDQGGGAIHADGGNIAFVNDAFSANKAETNGSAIDLVDGVVCSVTNCTLAANLSKTDRGAIRTDSSSNVTVSNAILWSDGKTEYAGSVNIRYSDVEGGIPSGEGNISDDPKLLDAIGHDLHIGIGSACIDKGDKASLVTDQDQDGRARTIGTAPDMGAYEFPIVRPLPLAAASSNLVFTIPHDGNPFTNTAPVKINGEGFDWLLGNVSYQWLFDGNVVATTQTLSLALEVGLYDFTLQVRDPSGGFATRISHVKVLPEQNTAPIASAGQDQTVTFKGTSVPVVVHGSGYDADGDPVSYKWSTGATTQDLSVTLNPGIYVYTLTVTDPYGASSIASVTIHVVDGLGPIVTLNGITPMTLEVFSPWIDPGATAKDETDGGDLAVTTYGTVDTNHLGPYTITYTAKDNSGNPGSATRLVNVADTIPPVITLNGQSPMQIQCGAGYTEPGATAIDNYDGPVPVDITGEVLTAVGTYTVTYTAVDSSNNKAVVTRTVSVVDTSAPVITLNGDNPMTVECGKGYNEPGASAKDSCDGTNIPVTISGTVPSVVGSYTITYTATDGAGNTATAARTVNVVDTGAPIITLNGDNPMTVECSKGYSEPGATAKDDCGNVDVPVVITGSVPSSVGTYTITYTATDAAGNIGTATRTVNVVDTTGPVITLKGSNPMSVECGSGYVEPGATAKDGCDGTSVPVTITGTVNTVKGTYTISYKASDAYGNSTTVTRTVNVVDTTPPIITLNGSPTVTVECGQGYTEAGATAMDICDGIVTVKTSGTTSTAKGSYTITYTATDSSGNTATATRTVNVTDGTPPVITLNGANPMTVECGTGYTEPGATATDSCDPGSIPVVISGVVPTTKGTYTVTYTATDSSGNKATATRTVNVTDTKAPVITLNGSNPMSVECATGYVEPGATALDSCEGSLPVTITGTVQTSKGVYTVTYKATDSSGNSATATRTVNVTDTTPPVITLNGSNPMTVACGSGYTDPGATANDACDGSVSVVMTGSVLTSKGVYTVTYKATDSSGNTATATRTVNVTDTTPPVITLNGSNPMTVQCGSGYVEPGATAADACDGTDPVVITGSVLTSKGTYTVTYKSTDSAGNTSTVTRTVNVVDTTPPVITLNGSNPMTVECGSGYAEPGATATDACDGTLTVTITGSVLTSKGTYIKTYKATDSSGNTATVTRTVNVIDTTPPVITLSGSNPMTVQCGAGYTEPGATATDACDGTLTVTITGTVLTSKGTYTETYKATDSSGNSTTVTRTVNVVDTTPPVITLNGSNPMTVQCGSGYTEPGATATDACDGNISVVITGSVPATVGTYTITYKATDSSGNVATTTRTVNVIDTVAPVITLNGSNPMSVECQKGYTEPGATAVDACDGSVAVTISGSVPSAVGTYTVTYTATDSHGNTATVTRTVVVTTKIPPSANNFNATPTSIKGGKTTNVNLHYGFDAHCAAYTWDVECTASPSAGSVITKVDNNNFTITAVTGTVYTFTLTVTDSLGNFSTYQITVNGT